MSSSMYFSFCDTGILTKLYPEAVGINCDDKVYRKMRQDPIGWLNTLPMYEYAHVMMKLMAHHLGGNPVQYVKVLYNLLLSPILTRYYKELELYRFKDAEIERQYDIPRYLADKNETRVGCRNKMCMCTAHVKMVIRYLCDIYTWMKDKPLDDALVQYWTKFVKKIAEEGDIKDWLPELKQFAKEMQNRDLKPDIQKVNILADKQVIIAKLQEIVEVLGVDVKIAETASLNYARDTLNICIAEFNVKEMDGSNSWVKFAQKLNEFIEAINNQKKRKIHA